MEDLDTEPIQGSSKPITSGGVYAALQNIPSGGGDSSDGAEEIFYVDGTFDMQTLTFSTNVTYAEISAAVQSSKYIVAKAQAYMGEYNTDIIF